MSDDSVAAVNKLRCSHMMLHRQPLTSFQKSTQRQTKKPTVHYKLLREKSSLGITNWQKQVTKQYVYYDLNFFRHTCTVTENKRLKKHEIFELNNGWWNIGYFYFPIFFVLSNFLHILVSSKMKVLKYAHEVNIFINSDLSSSQLAQNSQDFIK